MLPALVLALAAAAPAAQGPVRPAAFRVQGYSLQLGLDLAGHGVRGREEIRLVAGPAPLAQAEFDVHDLEVTAVEGRAVQGFALEHGRLSVRWRRALRPGERARFTLAYRGTPAQGLSFREAEVVTFFDTCHWMVCDEDPGDRSTFELKLDVPAGWSAVASGEPCGAGCWRQSRPIPAFVFGFAVGRLAEQEARAGEVRLRSLSTRFSPEQLARIFALSPAMVAFFQDKAGVAYPSRSYTQVLTDDSLEQEVAGFALMGNDDGQATLENPHDVWIYAHELAHQWWGIEVGCASWSDFWLNEGLASFMADAFLEQSFGAEAGAAQRAKREERYEQLKAAGKDRPLHFTGWTTPQEASGPVPYQKGALALHRLRREIGDAAFWTGLRDYTRANAGKSVTSRDLQAAMERAARRSLQPFFDAWVYR